MADMETEAVVPKLVEEGIILRSVQKAIDDASSREEKNKLLYDDLLKYCTEDTLMTVCKVAIGTVDMKKMVELGQSLANELKRGLFNVHWLMHALHCHCCDKRIHLFRCNSTSISS